jgi:hypothetical protein
MRNVYMPIRMEDRQCEYRFLDDNQYLHDHHLLVVTLHPGR